MGIIQTNEIYVNDDRLCYLFSLLINKGAKISCANKHIADEFKQNFEVFVSEIFETYIQTLSQQKQEQIITELSDYDSELIPYKYNNWYKISYSDEEKELSIELKDEGVPLDKTLKRYVDKYWEDDLHTWNETNHYSSEKICRDFYQHILDYNAKTYYVDDMKNIHAIALGYYKGYIEINKIECHIDLSDISNMLFHPCYVNEYPTNLVTYFKCNINAHLFKIGFDNLIKGQNNPQLNTKVVNKITKYPPQQQTMYDYIVNFVKEKGCYKLDPYKLRYVLGLKSFDKDTDILNNAVSVLNKCYKEINGTNKPLIKKNKRSGFYYITFDLKI